jgi:hypothetical protein
MTEGTKNGNGNGNGSTLEWLRDRHAQLSADRTLDLAVPGYGGRLVLRCGPAPYKPIARMAQLEDDGTGEGLLKVNADVIIGACRAVLVRDDAGELVSIDQEREEPVRINKRLADLLDTGTTTARETLAWLFPSDVAIGTTAAELLRWTQGAEADIAEDFISG